MKHLWFDLIYKWCVENRRFGLSIPYLVGAERLYGKSKTYSIKDLVYEIVKSKYEHEFVLRYCNDLDEYVLGIENPIYSSIKAARLKNYGPLFTDDELNRCKDISEVIEFLERKYEKIIDNCQFSKNLREYCWEGFTLEEIEIIKSCVEI